MACGEVDYNRVARFELDCIAWRAVE